MLKLYNTVLFVYPAGPSRCGIGSKSNLQQNYASHCYVTSLCQRFCFDKITMRTQKVPAFSLGL